jgi:hypothetical protein
MVGLNCQSGIVLKINKAHDQWPLFGQGFTCTTWYWAYLG